MLLASDHCHSTGVHSTNIKPLYANVPFAIHHLHQPMHQGNITSSDRPERDARTSFMEQKR